MGGLRVWQCRSRYRRGAAAVVLFLLAWLAGTCLLHRWLSIDPDDVPFASPHQAALPRSEVGQREAATVRAEQFPNVATRTLDIKEPAEPLPTAQRNEIGNQATSPQGAATLRGGGPQVETSTGLFPTRETRAAIAAPRAAEPPSETSRHAPIEQQNRDEVIQAVKEEVIPAPTEVEPSRAVGGNTAEGRTAETGTKSANQVAPAESGGIRTVPAGHAIGGEISQPPAGGPPKSGGIIQAGCSACGGGGGLLRPGADDSPAGLGGCSTCGAGVCVGRKPCYPCDGHTTLTRFLCGVYQCVCCPDPCYEGHWRAVGNAAFFVDPIRPQTQQRLRWDAGFDLIFPDRAEFFWPKQNAPGPFVPPPFLGEKRVAYHDLSMYTEVSAGLISFFVELPYRSLKPELLDHAAGFSDMNLGSKTLLYDCELFQLAFQIRTYLPTGNFSKGLGAGHVSLEPSLLLGVNVAPDTYFQAQVAEWIPFGLDPGYSGALLHYHLSVNQVVWRVLPDVPLIGTMEFNGWSFQNGSYTDPVLGPYQKASGETYVSLGPGIRLVICDKADFGIGTAFAVTRGHWADELFRSEFRWRF